MDDHRLDRFARALSACTSRREAVRLLGAAALIRPWPQQVSAAQQSTDCERGLTYCAGAAACIDLGSNLDHCGACDNVCASDLITVACRNGECVRADCPEGLAYCGPTQLCRDLYSDPGHCGSCDTPCPSGRCAGGVCVPEEGGECQVECGICPAGQTNCGGQCVDTCCDNTNCGRCGNACTGGLTCFEGVCDCPSGLCCAEGETLCGGSCVATCCDNNNCGACGHVCKKGRTCSGGTCSCPGGLCLPNTGHGSGPTWTDHGKWAGVASAGIASALAAMWHASRNRLAGRSGAIDAAPESRDHGGRS
jgi:hypothetical protein